MIPYGPKLVARWQRFCRRRACAGVEGARNPAGTSLEWRLQNLSAQILQAERGPTARLERNEKRRKYRARLDGGESQGIM